MSAGGIRALGDEEDEIVWSSAARDMDIWASGAPKLAESYKLPFRSGAFYRSLYALETGLII